MDRLGILGAWPSPLRGVAAATVEGVSFTAMLFISDDDAELDFDWYCEDEKRPGRLPRWAELEAPQASGP